MTARSASRCARAIPAISSAFCPNRCRARRSRMFAAPRRISSTSSASATPRRTASRCLIGNCQAGWQVMMMAAMFPDLPGPIVLAGTPLSYWAGVRGKNPMRYLGGMLGGAWLTSLAGDMGNGIFDGAALVANFESQQPCKHLMEEALQRLRQRRHRGRTVSRIREMVGRSGSAERRGDAVHRRRIVRRQQARRRRAPNRRWRPY